jgi:hypothetical protein
MPPGSRRNRASKVERRESGDQRRNESIDAYEDIGPRDADVLAVAWDNPENLIPVAPGSFRTYFVSDNAPHGVEFDHKDTGEPFQGNADKVFGFVWQHGEKIERVFLGTKPPPWAS